MPHWSGQLAADVLLTKVAKSSVPLHLEVLSLEAQPCPFFSREFEGDTEPQSFWTYMGQCEVAPGVDCQTRCSLARPSELSHWLTHNKCLQYAGTLSSYFLSSKPQLCTKEALRMPRGDREGTASASSGVGTQLCFLLGNLSTFSLLSCSSYKIEIRI